MKLPLLAFVPFILLVSFSSAADIPYRLLRELVKNAEIIDRREGFKASVTVCTIEPRDQTKLRLTLKSQDGEQLIPLNDAGVPTVPELKHELWDTAFIAHNMAAEGGVDLSMSYSLEEGTLDLQADQVSGLTLSQFTERLMNNKDVRMLVTEILKLFKEPEIEFMGVQGLEIYPSQEIVGAVYLTRDYKEVVRYKLDSKRSVIWNFQDFHPDHCKIHFDIKTKDSFPQMMVVLATKEELKAIPNAIPLNLESAPRN